MRIMITGITGTIGRAFADFLQNDFHVVGIDRNEESVAKFKRDYPDIDVSVGDFGDLEFLPNSFDLLIHLAASKHIDLCEENPSECVINNVTKTHQLFKNAYYCGVRILFMSTDKAVEPSSVYGYSKAIGEALAISYGGSFIRSGNVVASNGSVLKVWDDAIANGAPVKVTHKDMKRYFISPENLVERAWEKFIDGEKRIIPVMDREVKLTDLLEEKLKAHGYTISDYPGGVEYTGLRAGEKLEERLDWK